jgi:hypothetical protein
MAAGEAVLGEAEHGATEKSRRAWRRGRERKGTARARVAGGGELLK